MAANFLLTSLKTIQYTADSMTRVIAVIAYMVNKIRLALSLYKYYYHKVQFMAPSDNPSMADEHNVPINLCPQNKICISEFPGKLISQNVLTILQPDRPGVAS